MKPVQIILSIILTFLIFACQQPQETASNSNNDLVFNELATSWDEGIPLGNGMLGALIWQNGINLRFSLDRADLWDLRPVENLSKPEFSYKWVQEQVKNNTYKTVQELFDVPYDQMPAPSKIPGAALEFDISSLGKVKSVRLDISNAICLVEWENGATLETFVHAENQAGWFRFTGIPEDFAPQIIPPKYKKQTESGEDSPVTGQDLQRLRYEQGTVTAEPRKQVYRQKGWNGFEYEVAVTWQNSGKNVSGIWSISSSFSEKEDAKTAGNFVTEISDKTNFDTSFKTHINWWQKYWDKSSISLPDSILEKQYYLEMYKFGAAARDNAPPISLQAVWTADNGKLPPWKGDFHNDLNTQLSYWPAYTGNHLELGNGYINWMWDRKSTFEKYTKTYFGTSGMNVPGVTTLSGEPMGGWIQYSFGPTVASWLAQHFYLHWIYSQDKDFLKEKAYPWIKNVAIYLEEISVRDEKGFRILPISSSPEINNNDISAWFQQTTNFDLAFIKWNFEKAAELAKELELPEEANKWSAISKEWRPFAVDSISGGLAFAPGYPYRESHRHFSHLVAWHPLGIIDWSNGEEDQKIINATIAELERVGTDWWCGYSFSWMGNLYARAFMGEKAAGILRVFAENFCLPNSFHVNGEQHNRGYSKFKYRPFTLEGNFTFASAIQEMLIQSHTGIVRVFPAVPADWKDVSFNQLRTTGAFLVSANRKDGKVEKIEIFAEKGGLIKLANPFAERQFKGLKNLKEENGILEIEMKPGEKIVLEAEN